ncbi:hypothetical protein SDC64_10650 [Acinetobacter haemolyticus]|uniref:hypothetical protein n=1 Tax=Acinetobacter haemolyticus TaxID=29430 RepID=UPI002A6A75F3|nr:hypothetical protein [Acinetobacter haemolyticus]WPO66391.1 hypothetical protein SDC64_10650 [Acinetobacter haemolyticus]
MGRYKKYLAIFLMFSIHMMPFNAARAASGEETVDMLRKKIQIMSADIQDTRKKVVGYKRSIRDIVNEAGAASTVVKHHVAETVPTKSKVGKPMLERAKKFKGGLLGVVGGAAVTGLLEAVGWVFEEGTFVKYKEPEYPPDEYDYCYTPQGGQQTCFAALGEAARSYVSYRDSIDTIYSWKYQYAQPNPARVYFQRCSRNNPNSCLSIEYNNLTKRLKELEVKREKVTITDEHVGGIILGDYVDPVDSKHNDISKNWKSNVVVAAYTEDPNGIGNEASDEMERKLDNAPPTPDGKPAPPGDSRYQNQEPTEDKPNQNDRSWEDTGGKAEGESNPKTDPETGEQTGGQNISLQFPVFCEWAHKVCSWYDDWKVSDKVYKDHLKKTEEHQTDEKTFWQKVTDFFTFIKTNDLDEDTEIEIDDDQTETVDTDIAFATGCPVFPIQANWHGFTLDFTIDLTNMCDAFTTIVKPIVISMATFSSIYILAGVRNDE